MKKNDAADWRSALGTVLSQMDTAGATDAAPSTGPEPAEDPQVQTTPLHLELERKGRAGKTAVVVFGFTIPDDKVAALAAKMKKALGTGGSVRGSEILIQGDRRDDIRRFLQAQGFKVK